MSRWWQQLFSRPASAPIARRPTRRRPLLERLEARETPATFHVANNSDNDPGNPVVVGSLREAVNLANANSDPDDIVFDAGASNVVLRSGTLTISSNVTLIGSTTRIITVRRTNADFRLFTVTSTGIFSVRNLTLREGVSRGGAGAPGNPGAPGHPGQGGAIANSGTLTVNAVTFLDNSAVGGRGGAGENHGDNGGPGGQGQGGAIWNNGTANIFASSFNDNIAQGGAGGNGSPDGAGGGAFGGAIYNVASSVLTFTGAANTFGTGPAANEVRAGIGSPDGTASQPNVYNNNGVASFVFTQAPPTVTRSGLTFDLTVQARDANGTVVTTFNSPVTIGLAAGFPSGGAIAGDASNPAVLGVASFSSLSLNKGGTYTLTATDGARTDPAPNTTKINASSLVYTAIPTEVRAGSAAAPANVNQFTITLEGRDSTGTAADIDADVGVVKNSGPGTLSGSASATNVTGSSVSFSGLYIAAGGSYQLQATVAGGSGGSLAVPALAGVSVRASHLVFTAAPTKVRSGGSNNFAVTVVGHDELGNVAAIDATVTLSVAGGGTALQGTLARTEATGTANFTGLSFNAGGTYQIAAIPSNDGGGTLLPPIAPTANIKVNAGTVVYSAVPTEVRAGSAAGPAAANQFTVTLQGRDASGNAADIEADVALALAGNPAGLQGTTSFTNVTGTTASFTGLYIAAGGAHNFQTTLTNATAGTLGAPAASPVAVRASHLVLGTVPTKVRSGSGAANNFTITVVGHDELGNDAAIDADVTIALATGTGTLGGTTTKTVAGALATFNNLTLDNAGTYTIAASSANAGPGMLGPPLTATGNIKVNAAALVYTSVPTGIRAGSPGVNNFNVTVAGRDVNGNVADIDADLSIAFAGRPGVLKGNTNLSGVDRPLGNSATFTSLYTRASGSFAFEVTVSGAAPGTLTPPPNAPVTTQASRVVFDVVPSKVRSGKDGGGANVFTITLKGLDEDGDAAPIGATVALAINGGGTALEGTLSKAATGNTVTFDDLTLDTAGSFSIAATLSGSGSAGLSGPSPTGLIKVNAGGLVYTLAPPTSQRAANSGTHANAFNVTLEGRDASGGLADIDADVTLGFTGAPGVLKGTTALAPVAGTTAAYTGLHVMAAGSYTFRVTLPTGDGPGTLQLPADIATVVRASKLVFENVPTKVRSSAGGAGDVNNFAINVKGLDENNNAAAIDADVSIGLTPASPALLGTKSYDDVTGNVVNFTDLALNAAGSYQIAAAIADSGAGTLALPAVTGPIKVNASSLVYTLAPPASLRAGNGGGLNNFNVTLVGRDVLGNAADIDADVSLALTGGTLAGTTGSTGATRNPDDTTAAFTGLHVMAAGSYTFRVSLPAGDGPGTLGLPADIATIVRASHLVVQGVPAKVRSSDGAVANPNNFTITVKGRDEAGNDAAIDADVSLALVAGAGLLGTTSFDNVTGNTATFAGLALNTAGSYQIAVNIADSGAGSLGLPPAPAGPIKVNASSLVYTLAPPASLRAGNGGGLNNFNVTLVGRDVLGNAADIDADVSLALTGGTLAGTTGSTGATRNPDDTTAAFTGLHVMAAGSYTFRVSLPAGDGPGTLGLPADIGTVVRASKLVFEPVPAKVRASAGGAGNPNNFTVTVKGLDENNNTAAIDADVSLVPTALNPYLTGTLTRTVAGSLATFDNLGISAGGTYAFTAAFANAGAGTLAAPPAASSDVKVNASRLGFFFPPDKLRAAADAAHANAFNMFVVGYDAEGFTADIDADVTLGLAAGTLGGGGTHAAVTSNFTTYTGLFIRAGGSHAFRVTHTNAAGLGTLTPDADSPVTVRASRLAYDLVPSKVRSSAGGAGNPNNFTVRVVGLDEQATPAPAAIDADVALDFLSGLGVATSTPPQNVAGNVATFDGLALAAAGTYQVGASVANVTPGSLTALPVAAGPSIKVNASDLVYITFPTAIRSGVQLGRGATNTFTVALQGRDVNGGLADIDATVNLAKSSGPLVGTLGGTTGKFAAAGDIVFDDLTLDAGGTYRLNTTVVTAAPGGSDGVLTAPGRTDFIKVNASKVVFTGTPTNVRSGLGTSNAFAVTLQGRDELGLAADLDAVLAFDVDAYAGPYAGGALSAPGGTTSGLIADAVVTFNGLTLDVTGNYTLKASVSGGTSEGVLTPQNPSAPIKVNASSFEFAPVPTAIRAGRGATNAFGITVRGRDVRGNLADLNSNVLLAITPVVTAGPFVFGGTHAVFSAVPLATFDGLTIDRGGSYTLSASPAGSVGEGFLASPPPTGVIKVNASTIVFVSAPTKVRSGTGRFNPFTVAIEGRDFTNSPADLESTITLAKAQGPARGVLAGTTTINATGTRATFATLTLDVATPGIDPAKYYRLTAVSRPDPNILGSLTPLELTRTIKVNAARLAFQTAPSNLATRGQALRQLRSATQTSKNVAGLDYLTTVIVGRDVHGNLADIDSTITLGVASAKQGAVNVGNVKFRGRATLTISGVSASFTTAHRLTIDRWGTYTLKVTSRDPKLVDSELSRAFSVTARTLRINPIPNSRTALIDPRLLQYVGKPLPPIAGKFTVAVPPLPVNFVERNFTVIVDALDVTGARAGNFNQTMRLTLSGKSDSGLPPLLAPQPRTATRQVPRNGFAVQTQAVAGRATFHVSIDRLGKGYTLTVSGYNGATPLNYVGGAKLSGITRITAGRRRPRVE